MKSALRKLIPPKGVFVKVAPRFISRFVQSEVIVALRNGTRNLFHKHLLVTNLAISGGLSAAGDCIEQEYEKLKDKDRKYSCRRTLNMTSAGVVIGGIVHYWYLWLDKFLPGRTFKLAVKKMLLDQIIGSPISIGAFFVTLAIVERSSADEFIEELKSKSWRLYLAEWVVWPPAQLINFFFLPLRYRLLFDNTISLGYDVYTSYVKNEIHTEKGSSLPSTSPALTSSSSSFKGSIISEIDARPYSFISSELPCEEKVEIDKDLILSKTDSDLSSVSCDEDDEEGEVCYDEIENNPVNRTSKVNVPTL